MREVEAKDTDELSLSTPVKKPLYQPTNHTPQQKSDLVNALFNSDSNTKQKQVR